MTARPILRIASVGVALFVGGCIEDAVLVSSGGGQGGATGTGTSAATGQGGAGAASSTAASATGGSVGCSDPAQCPGVDTSCRWRTCDGDVCGVAYAEQAVPCTEDGGALCDGLGACVECIGDEHCVSEPCVNNVCGLKLPNGDPCDDDAECESDHCADGVCCDDACGGTCEACVTSKTCGQDGICAPIAAGTDPDVECNGANACFGGACLTGKVVFTTSTAYNGNLGGLMGADAKCQMHATMACLGGSYMAWLSTNSISPSTRFNQSTVPYRRVDGTLVAQNWGDLVDGQISAPLSQDERGDPPPMSMSLGSCMPDLVYSGTTAMGTPLATAAERCSDWTDGNTSDGTWGRFTISSGNWSQYCTGSGGTCFRESPIYCFQQ